jgi:hypothetical protein
LGKLAPGRNCRQPIAHGKHDNEAALTEEKTVAAHEYGVGPFSHDGGKGRLDLADGAGAERKDLHPKRRRDFARFLECGFSRRRIAGIDQHRNANGFWDKFAQKPQPRARGRKN